MKVCCVRTKNSTFTSPCFNRISLKSRTVFVPGMPPSLSQKMRNVNMNGEEGILEAELGRVA